MGYSGYRGNSPQNKKRHWLATLLALLIAGALALGALELVIWRGAQGRTAQAGDGPEVMVIFGCQVKPDGPSILLRDRLDTALAYWEEHPSVYVAHEGGVNEYDIFAAFEASVDSDVYRRGFSQTEDREAFISWCLEQSVIDTGVRPTAEGRIITLSTCTQSGGAATRWVVLASLAETEENSSAG